jgi:signal transduction histidine kinase
MPEHATAENQVSPIEPGQARFARTVVVLGIIIQLLAALLGDQPALSPQISLLALMAYYGERRAVRLPGYGDVNVGEGFYFVAACLHGPLVGGLLSASLGYLHDKRRGKRAVVTLFNLGWSFATFGLVGAAFQLGGWGAAGVAFVIAAGTLQAFGESRFLELPLSQTLRHQAREVLLVAPAIAFVSALCVLLLGISPWGVVLLAFPLELVSSYLTTRELHRQLSAAHQELAQTQAELVAQGRQAALGVMAAGISHEINNPLAAARTSLHLLKILGKDPKLKAPMDLLEQAIARCQNIVERMLKYSRAPGGVSASCSAAEVMEDTLLFAGRVFDQTEIVVSPDLNQLSPVSADPAELVQILSNLVNNAHDAGAARIEILAEQEGQTAHLLVRDNGEGIPAELRASIFEPFFTTKAVGSGTGLGLAVAQGLARGCGGNLSLERSGPGETVFRLSLPTAKRS